MAAKMSRTDAAMALISAGSYTGGSVTRRVQDYKRALRAMDVLDIRVPQDRFQILYALEFVDREGLPWVWLQNRLARP